MNNLIWLMPLLTVGPMKPEFTVHVTKRHSLATLEPPPTDKDIAKTFRECPWAQEIAVAARGEVLKRKEWLAQYHEKNGA